MGTLGPTHIILLTIEILHYRKDLKLWVYGMFLLWAMQDVYHQTVFGAHGPLGRTCLSVKTEGSGESSKPKLIIQKPN